MFTQCLVITVEGEVTLISTVHPFLRLQTFDITMEINGFVQTTRTEEQNYTSN